jgi:hypothetical protein
METGERDYCVPETAKPIDKNFLAFDHQSPTRIVQSNPNRDREF